ncbi:MAG: hypothetical protein K6G30_14160 [Acetatifactor sp.]|nr:hypothetical protein [Acetatifactor sp.]
MKMLKFEKKIIEWGEKNIWQIMFVAVSIAAVLVRIRLYPFVSDDMEGYLIPWFDQIKRLGGVHALSTQVGNYNALYQTLIALMTYIPINPLYQYKNLSVFFDFVLAFYTARYVYLETGKEIPKTLAAYSLVLLSPIVMMNSAMWGQCDSIYVSFLVATLLYIRKEKYPLAFVMFGLAMAFKLQAVFLLPFLLFAYVRTKKFSMLNFLIVPAVMFVACIPTCVMGRSWQVVFAVYYYQTFSCDSLYFSYPTFWSLLTQEDWAKREILIYFKNGIILLTIAALAGLMVYLIHKKVQVEGENILYIAFLMIYICVLLLPGMHDRYGFAYEILAIVVAIKERKTIPLLVGLLLMNLVVYGHAFFGTPTIGSLMGLINVVIFYFYAKILLGRLDGINNV